MGKIESKCDPEAGNLNTELDFHDKKVLVTGASGFVGSRLVDYLVFHYQADVRALVRSYGRAVQLARLPVELALGDLTDVDSLRKAASGCEVIIHCAAGTSGEDEDRYAATVDGTRNILQAALEAKVKRFVHVSTVAVHGPDPGQVIDESTPLVKSNDLYADSKVEAEELVSQFGHEKGLPVVILRPTIVYGPRAGGWTLGPVNHIRAGGLTLINSGSGVANHVYVDDVVQAILLAAKKPQAVGETFLISHGSGVTWKEFFGYYAQMLGVDELPSVTVEAIEAQRKQFERLRNPFYLGLTFAASPHARSVLNQIPGMRRASRMMKKALPMRMKHSMIEQAEALREIKLNPPVLPRPWMVNLYTAKGICKIDKARQLLGYQPQVTLDEGMRLTEAWLRHQCLIS